MSDDAPEQGGYSGRAVLVLLLLVSVATVVISLTFIRPAPNAEPAPVNRRPFGPASAEDANNRPLIEKGGGPIVAPDGD